MNILIKTLIIIQFLTIIAGLFLSIGLLEMGVEINKIEQDYDILLDEYNENLYMYKKMEGMSSEKQTN